MRRLLLEAAVGLCTLVASLALVLFTAAGSVHFWQAWLYLATFALSVVVITAYLAVYDRALLATPAALGSWAALPCALALVLTVVVRLIEEERCLRVHLEGYEAYRARVPYRLVPFVW